jgi:ABC-type Zn2+ transport system substrate-binding protein/surface adhesin
MRRIISTKFYGHVGYFPEVSPESKRKRLKAAHSIFSVCIQTMAEEQAEEEHPHGGGDDHHGDDHHGDDHHGQGHDEFHLYARPRQRQRWGESKSC